MSTLVMYASGHPRLYSTDEEEIAAVTGEAAGAGGRLGTIDPEDPAVHWWPSTLDFREEARRHARRPSAIGSLRQFIRTIRRQHNLDQAMFFGHGGRDLLKFGDTVYVRSADFRALGNADLSGHFTSSGSIILYACNAAYTEDFMQAMADAFRVRVCGFRNGVRWNIGYDGQRPNRTITSRGVHGGALPTNFTCFNPAGAQTGATLAPSFTREQAPSRWANYTGPVRAGRTPGPTGTDTA